MRSSTPAPGSASRGSSAAAARSSSTCATSSPTPRRRRDRGGHPVRRGLQAARAVPGPRRSRARDRQADPGRQGRPQPSGPGRGGRPLRLARGRGPGHRCGPRGRRRDPLCGTSTSCSRRPSSSPAAGGWAGGSGAGRTGVVTVSTGEASLIADLAPRTGVDLPPVPDAARAALLAALPTLGYIGNPLDPWGADRPAAAYGAAFDAFAAAGRLRRPRPRPRLPVPLAAVARSRRRSRSRRRCSTRPRDRPDSCPSSCR